MERLTQAGQFWCSYCLTKRDFVVCEDASPTEQRPDIECYACGFTYSKIVEEFDPKTGETYDNPIIREALSDSQRRAALGDMKSHYVKDMIRGNRSLRETFTNPKPKEVQG